MATSALARHLDSRVIANYAIAVVSVAAAVVASLLLDRLGWASPSLALFLCVIMLVGWGIGTGPALLATVVSLLAFAYFFLHPVQSFDLQFKDFTRLGLFAISAAIVVAFTAAQTRATDSLRRMRDQNEQAVRELETLNETLRIENAERKRAEEKARLAEERLQSIIDTIPTLVARRGADGHIDFVNQTWRTYTGFLHEDPKELEVAAFHPEDRARIEQEWLSHLARSEAFDTEYRLRRADGEYRWLSVRRVPLRDSNGDVIAWYGVGYDIEDRKRAETALRKSEAQLLEAHRELQLTIDSIPALVATYEPDGTRSFVNQTWRNYTGLTLKEKTGEALPDTVVDEGKTYFHYFHPDDAGPIEDAWHSSLATGEPLQFEVRVRRADGEYRWHTVRRVPVRDERGQIIRWYSTGFDIEDQKIAEGALRRSEARLAKAERELRLTLDSIPAITWRAGANGYVEQLNKRWFDYTGTTHEQVRGWRWKLCVHPDDIDQLVEVGNQYVATGTPIDGEARLRRFDGEYRWFLFRPAPDRDETGKVVGWYGVITDIEDRKRAEQKAIEAERELQQTIDGIPAPIGTYHADGSRLAINKRVREYSGLSSVDDWHLSVHPDDKELADSKWGECVARGEPFELEYRTRKADGTYRWHLTRRVPVRDDAGKVLRWYGIGYDIEDQKRAEEALHAAQTALAHASRVATLGEVSATIAHEVNQPLAAIVINGQACLRFLARETPDLSDVRNGVESMVKDANRAGEVIQRVRGLLKKADTQKVPVNVNDAIAEVAALLRREIAAHEVSLQQQLAPARLVVSADLVQLQQVLINLVMNAIEAMQGIVGRPRTLAVRSYEDEARQIVVSVSDNGPGIPAEMVDRVFDAFFSTKPAGLGMGLSICRSIIEDHAGRLRAMPNADGPGATFHFTLPACLEVG